MNGEPVPADHGKPVRLAVPGWYGCSWIKWVNEIRLVGPDERGDDPDGGVCGRTHQAEPHKLARDYAPADIQTAATPVRVEKRKRPQRHRIPDRRHRVGRHKPVDRLQIRFGNDAAVRPFSVCPMPKTHRCGRCGHTAGSRRNPGATTSRSKSPIVGAAAPLEVAVLHAAG